MCKTAGQMRVRGPAAALRRSPLRSPPKRRENRHGIGSDQLAVVRIFRGPGWQVPMQPARSETQQALDANQARWQLLKERQNIAPLELTANNYIAIRIDSVNLKNRLRDIETDSRDRLYSLAPPNHRVP